MDSKLKEGEAFFAAGNIGDAEKCFLSVVENNPRNKEAYNNLGVIAFQKGNKVGAIDYFTISLEIDPFYKDAIINYTDLLKTLNQLHIAAPFLKKIAEIHPDDEEIRQLLRDLPNDFNNKTVSISANEGQSASLNKENQTNGKDVLSGKRILHAPFEIAGNMARISRYLRSHNVSATSANYYDSWLQYKCDINLNINNFPENERFKAIDNFARDAIDKYDIFHFHFSHSLYPDFRDLEEIKKKGRKIIFSFWGSDARGPEWIFYQQARFLGYNPPKPYFLTLKHYHNHKIINRYADVMLGALCIPRGLLIPGLIDVSEWSFEEKEQILQRKLREKDPKKTYFLHAPSANWKKGSSIIINLLEKCKKDGLPIEILYVSNVMPEDAKQIYAYADFAIDQVGVGTFGLFGIEMMCWQIPVLTYQTELFDKIRNYPPVVKITKANFKSQIERCIEMKKSGENVEFGKKSRRWVLEVTGMASSLPEYLRIYRDLAEGKRIAQYVNNSWYQQEHLIQSGFKSEFYKYMIENKVFNEIGVTITDYDKRLYV
jgi:tetratricopeptide (TPR) repeat protein